VPEQPARSRSVKGDPGDRICFSRMFAICNTVMKATLLILFACLLPLPSPAADPEPYSFDLSAREILPMWSWQIRPGDQAEWATRPGAGSAWQTIRFDKYVSDYAAGEANGRFWLQASLDLRGAKDDSDALALFFTHLPSAFELFWDGVPVWRNGRVGTDRRSERLGELRGIIPLPYGLVTPGRHRIAVRVSNHHIQKSRHDFEFILDYRSSLEKLIRQRKEENLLYLGLFQTALLFSLFLFLGGWRYFPALFLCAFTFIKMLDNLWYILQRSNLLGITLFYHLKDLLYAGYLIALLPLNLFILWHLDIPRKKTIAAALAGLSALRLALFFQFEWNLWQLDLGAALVILGLIVRQCRRKQTGSGTALAGYGIYIGYELAVSLIPILPVLAFSSTPYFSLLPNSIFLVMLMGSVTLKLREHFQALAALRFRSERLEAELLKKSIQPHFIMNTLLSIKSYLGIDSARAERLIEALAEEFRLINHISKQGEIPLAEELNLCRLHLELMGYRRDARYELVTAGDCRGFSIPPMVLHTLVENGLTHAFKPKESGTFRFSCARQGRFSVFLLENDGANLGERLPDARSQQAEEGLGLRYVRARLEEAYPGKWRLDYGLRQGAWTVRIVIEAP
jgi:hypothetical protein